jgi:hypothetical protein
MLVQWGVDRANLEGVVFGCESTTVAYGFYKRFGMKGVGGAEGWIMRSALICAVEELEEDLIAGS